MADDGGGGDLPRAPKVEYRDSPKDPDHYVQVIAFIPGLSKKFMKDEADNADIDLKAEERSFSLHVTLNNSTNNEKEYLYTVKKLPEPIEADPSKTYYKVKKKGEVTVYLCKVHSGSWAGHLSKGLDMEY